jgi:(p)ppGpp synthase/HD superfamily hydrolase
VNQLEPGTKLSDAFIAAVSYVCDVHATQVRKGTRVPYVSHLLAVSASVLEAEADETVAIAALLHDTAEDQGGLPRLQDIRSTFGERVAEIVEGCSDSLAEDPTMKEDYVTRKTRYVLHLESADDDVLLVSVADKLHNARSIANDLRIFGPTTLERFKGSTAELEWYYTSILTIAENRAVSPVLLVPFQQAVSDLVGLLRQEVN